MIKYLATHRNKKFAIRLLLLHGFFFSILFEINGQNASRFPLGFADVYVLKVKLSESLLQKKSCCVYQKGTQCNLYKVQITNVLYCPSNTVFDSIGLLNVEYMIAPIGYADSLSSGAEFLITAMPSTSERYIALSRLLNMELINNDPPIYYHKQAYLSGLIKCNKKRKDVFGDFIKTQ